MILTEFLLAPTVPSAPRPKNLHSWIDCPPRAISSTSGREVNVTSSTIPTVKWFFGSGNSRLLNTEIILAGVTSEEPRKEGEDSRCENPCGEYARDGALARNVHQLENDFRVRVFLEIFFKFAVVERFVRDDVLRDDERRLAFCFPPLAEADFHCVHAFLRHERQVVAVELLHIGVALVLVYRFRRLHAGGAEFRRSFALPVIIESGGRLVLAVYLRDARLRPLECVEQGEDERERDENREGRFARADGAFTEIFAEADDGVPDVKHCYFLVSPRYSRSWFHRKSVFTSR